MFTSSKEQGKSWD